jgi:hypothetical protein
MRASPSILAATVGVFLVILGPSAFSQTATLCYDGAYRRSGADKTTQHLRFYPDGLVISAATPSAQTPSWFQRDWPGLTSGRYSLRKGRLEFTLKVNLPDSLPDRIPRALHYGGVIGPEYIDLHRDGLAEPKRYRFVKIAAFK